MAIVHDGLRCGAGLTLFLPRFLLSQKLGLGGCSFTSACAVDTLDCRFIDCQGLARGGLHTTAACSDDKAAGSMGGVIPKASTHEGLQPQHTADRTHSMLTILP